MVRIVVNRHIIPTLGKFPVLAVERAHVIKLHHRLCETPFMANAVISRLSLMYRLAEGWGLVPEGFNPCRQIVKYPEPARERFLTHEEFKRLARAFDEVETLGGASPSAVAALRLLMLTGCRRNEILTVRWEDVALDRRELTLRDAKTGPRVVPLSPSAVGLLSVLPRVRGNPWYFPASSQVRICATSTERGGFSARAPNWTMYAFMTFATRSRPEHWRSARPCR